LKIKYREPLATYPDGRAVPELVGGYHARKLPFTAPDLRSSPARRKPGADAGYYRTVSLPVSRVP
jgi:hypothetical protein